MFIYKLNNVNQSFALRDKILGPVNFVCGLYTSVSSGKGKGVPLHAMEAHGGEEV
jgi:hypothetical protein